MDTLTKQAAEKFIDVLKTEENKSKIENHFLDPFTNYIKRKFLPVFALYTFTMLLLIFVLLYIIYLILHLQNCIRLQDLKR